MQRYSVDIIAEQKDYQNEPDLILHWAVGRRSPSEWAKPEDQFLPPGSKRFDANCVQLTFKRMLFTQSTEAYTFLSNGLQRTKTVRFRRLILFFWSQKKTGGTITTSKIFRSLLPSLLLLKMKMSPAI